MSAELEDIWSRVQAELALAVDEPTYRIWLEPLRARDFADGRLLIAAPPQLCVWIRERFGRVLAAAAGRALADGTVVDLISDEHASARSADAPRGRAGSAAPGHHEWPRGARRAEAREHQPSGHEPGPALDLDSSAGLLGNPKLTFDQFVIGDCNRLAHAAALTVAEMPAHAYNPLFLCGPPGVGKTHLLSAIASLLATHSPELSVRCTTGEAFTNEFLHALSGRHTDDFKSRFRHIDVLLLDDVQFLERKTRTEEEFFHTFNALHEGGRQIVLTSDRPPQDLQALEDRLRERFEAGLVADLKPPDFTTRLAILRKRAQHDHLDVADEQALEVLARRVENNVRALEGALIRLVAFSSLTARPLTGELAHEVLASLYPRTATPARRNLRSVVEIQAAVCEHFGISSEELLSPARTPRIVGPRQLAMYLARQLTSESLPAIGRQFGGRDHTTVMHACRRTASRMASDDNWRKAVESLHASLGLAPTSTSPATPDRSA